MKIRIRWTHIFNLLIQFPIWLGSLVSGALIALPSMIFQRWETFAGVIAFILFFIGMIIGSIYLHKWLEPFATIWYLSLFCKTKVTYTEAGDLSFLFDGSLNGKWYPFKDLRNIPKEYRKKILYEFAEKIMGYKFKTNPYYSETYNNTNSSQQNTYTYQDKKYSNSDSSYSNKEKQNEQQFENKSTNYGYSNDFILACKIMGLNQNFTKEELKSKYRELMKQYHPDLFANSSNEIKNIAETKTRQINSAYEYLSNYKI